MKFQLINGIWLCVQLIELRKCNFTANLLSIHENAMNTWKLANKQRTFMYTGEKFHELRFTHVRSLD